MGSLVIQAPSADLAVPPSRERLLDARGVRKVFGGTVALAAADLEVRPGEIHGLLGENGAGKSTLIRLIVGVQRPDGGELRIGDVDLAANHSPGLARRAGIACIHQNLDLVGDLSVAENIAMEIGFPRGRFGLLDGAEMHGQAERALALMGVRIDPRRAVKTLPIAAQASVAIARALALDCRLLILDEPTASLAAGEVEALFAVLHRLREQGLGMLFVSHRMDEISAHCDRVTVLRNGRTVATERTADLNEDRMVELIVGHAVDSGPSEPPSLADTEPILVANGLEGAVVGPLSFAVRPGEIVGFTGLSDSGHLELGELIFGVEPREGGELTWRGEPFRPSDPRQAIGAGIAYVPANRTRHGVAPRMSLRENLFANPDPGGGLLNVRAEHQACQQLLERFDVRPAEPDREVGTLSGGNAQKALLAKWLARRPRLVVLNEPTTGVDIGAREQIYELVRAAAREGTAVVLISSDFDEIEQLSHRAMVLWRGLESGWLEGSRLSTNNITKAAVQRGR